MKRIFLTLLFICSLFCIDSCDTKDLKLTEDNPVELSVALEGSYLAGDPVYATIMVSPKHLGYEMDYFISYEQNTGQGVYKIEEEVFTTDHVHTITNDDAVAVAINFEGASEGLHQSKWSVRNSFDQVATIPLEFYIKKKAETNPVIDQEIDPDLEEEVRIAASDDTALSEDGEAIIIDVLANDTIMNTQDSLMIEEIGTVSHGIATIEDQKIRYAPNADFSGTEILSYTVTDGNGNASSAIITIEVVGAISNEAPVAHEDVVETFNDTPILIDVLSNDTDAEKEDLFLKSITNAIHGRAEIHNRQVKYIPNVDYIGEDKFEYIIEDASGNTATGIISINVKSIPILKIHNRQLEEFLVLQKIDQDEAINGQISIRDAESVSVLDLSNQGYEGNGLLDIKIFTNLTELNVDKNNITTLDLARNKSLKTLSAVDTTLGNLNLSDNPELESVSIANSSSFTIFNANNSPKLKRITITSTSIFDFDPTPYPLLEILNLNKSHNLDQVDVSQNPLLKVLDLGFNYYITELDLTKNPNLQYLDVNSLQTSVLDLSKNIGLETFKGIGNQVKILNFNKNKRLQYVEAGHRSFLQKIILKNDQGTLPYKLMLYDHVEQLDCIEVADVLIAQHTATANSWDSDYFPFSVDCN